MSLSGSLRLGAQTYATAVGALNNTLSVVNIAKDTLGKLGDITDKMIAVTEKAARRPIGAQGRRALDIQFRELADDFKKILEKSKIGDNSFLTTDGLTEIFLAVGLDKESSKSIADVFAQFVTPEEDTTLASEKVEGKKPLVIPAAAFTVPSRSGLVQLETLTDAPLTSVVAGISPTTSVFQASDDILNENPGVEAVFVRDSAGGFQSQGAGNLLGVGATLRAVNEVTGYSIIESSFDPLGENPAGEAQLFLLSEKGALVGQLTNFSGATIESVDMTSSDEMFAVSYVKSGQSYVDTIEITKGAAVTTALITNIERTNDSVTKVKIDNNGDYVAFQVEKPGPFKNIELYDVANRTYDNVLRNDSRSRDSLDYGFVADGGQIVYGMTVTDGSAERNLVLYQSSGGINNTLRSAVSYDAFATLQSGNFGTGGSFSLVENAGGVRTVKLYDADDATENYALVIGNDVVSTMSLAANASDSSRIDIGLVGSLPDISGDSDLEFYRIRYDPDARQNRRISSGSVQYSEILDPTRGITSRPAAYRLLNDLKALREQITSNVDALQNAFDVVNDNIALVRATGLALLDIGNQLTNETDAAAVAESLRRRIRESAQEALAQAENLDPIAVATLTYTSNGN